jgi:hypothetical protein
MSTHGETAFLREFKAQFEKVPGCPLHLLRAPWVAVRQSLFNPMYIGLTSPDLAMVMGSLGLSPRPMGRFSMAMTTSIPSMTFPKTTYLSAQILSLM